MTRRASQSSGKPQLSIVGALQLIAVNFGSGVVLLGPEGSTSLAPSERPQKSSYDEPKTSVWEDAQCQLRHICSI